MIPFSTHCHEAKRLFNEALSLMSDSSYLKAIHSFSEAIYHNPSVPSYYFNRAKCFYSLSNFESITSEYQSYLDSPLDDSQSFNNPFLFWFSSCCLSDESTSSPFLLYRTLPQKQVTKIIQYLLEKTISDCLTATSIQEDYIDAYELLSKAHSLKGNTKESFLYSVKAEKIYTLNLVKESFDSIIDQAYELFFKLEN